MSDTLVALKEPAVSREKSKFREYAESILWALLLAGIIRSCIVQAFEIPTGSMEDTLAVGDRLFVNRFIYGIEIPFSEKRLLKLRDPRQGDVIVFRFPQDRSKDFIKRVVGVPGDVVEGRAKQVFVNGRLYRNPHENHRDREIIPAEMNPRDTFGPVTVPSGSYFVMGDNRDRSYDSRFWGVVKQDDIKGKAILKYWSWDKDSWRVRWDRIGRAVE